MGSAPSRVGRCCVKGTGLQAIVLNKSRLEAIGVGGGGEINPEVTVDYADLASGVVRTTYHAWDPRRHREVPFVLETYCIDRSGKFRVESKLLLDGEKDNEEGVGMLVAEAVRELDDTSTTAFEDALAHLRNMAITNPRRILKAYEEIRRAVAARGHVIGSELLTLFEDEVAWIKRLKDAEARSAGDAGLRFPVYRWSGVRRA